MPASAIRSWPIQGPKALGFCSASPSADSIQSATIIFTFSDVDGVDCRDRAHTGYTEKNASEIYFVPM